MGRAERVGGRRRPETGSLVLSEIVRRADVRIAEVKMTPRLVSIVMAVAMASVGWLSSWRPASGAPPSELTRLLHLAVAHSAERAGDPEQVVVVREVHGAMVSVPLGSLPAGCRKRGAAARYEMLLLPIMPSTCRWGDGLHRSGAERPRPYGLVVGGAHSGRQPKALHASAARAGHAPRRPIPRLSATGPLVEREGWRPRP